MQWSSYMEYQKNVIFSEESKFNILIIPDMFGENQKHGRLTKKNGDDNVFVWGCLLMHGA